MVCGRERHRTGWCEELEGRPACHQCFNVSVSLQNTNGVNFYNILTKEPDDKLSSLAKDDFIGKLLKWSISGYFQKPETITAEE